MVTITEVAARAGVGAGTVSRVLNNSPKVSPATRSRVLETMAALDYELESALEWIGHPAVFSRDSRKAVLQTIGVISSQRGVSFRTPSESLWAARIPGVKNLTEQSREWREADESLAEEM